jgi:hypothetical protein
MDECDFCNNEAIETLTFGYETRGGSYCEDGHVSVCKDCINELGREGCIEEIKKGGEWI